MNPISIKELMQQSGVAFGTSGARGLVEKMTDLVCMAYTSAFLKHQDSIGTADRRRVLLVGGDRRPSSPRIMRAVAEAGRNSGYEVKSAGLIPSPALALWGMTIGACTVMVTGSHIPDDRNGLKFTTKDGEITKADEAGIAAQIITDLPAVDEQGMLLSPTPLPEPDTTPAELYLQRYLNAFGTSALSGIRLGVYGHSAVGRELLTDLYKAMGAEVVPLGFSDRFIPVDTEAIRPEDDELAAGWAASERLDAIVSTDGDSDRPLCSDENGRWFRGDVTGILTAKFLRADAVALPVSCNTALELSGWFKSIERTRIGSPFVIDGLKNLQNAGHGRVVGYEANGGFFNQTALDLSTEAGGGTLPPLPTRDPAIVHICMLMMAKIHGGKLSDLTQLLPPRITASGRDQSFSQARSAALLSQLTSLDLPQLGQLLELGPVRDKNTTDGLRLTFESGEILHLRPSGNAPELRCYAEASDADRASHLVAHGLEIAKKLTETTNLS